MHHNKKEILNFRLKLLQVCCSDCHKPIWENGTDLPGSRRYSMPGMYGRIRFVDLSFVFNNIIPNTLHSNTPSSLCWLPSVSGSQTSRQRGSTRWGLRKCIYWTPDVCRWYNNHGLFQDGDASANRWEVKWLARRIWSWLCSILTTSQDLRLISIHHFSHQGRTRDEWRMDVHSGSSNYFNNPQAIFDFVHELGKITKLVCFVPHSVE